MEDKSTYGDVTDGVSKKNIPVLKTRSNGRISVGVMSVCYKCHVPERGRAHLPAEYFT